MMGGGQVVVLKQRAGQPALEEAELGRGGGLAEEGGEEGVEGWRWVAAAATGPLEVAELPVADVLAA